MWHQLAAGFGNIIGKRRETPTPHEQPDPVVNEPPKLATFRGAALELADWQSHTPQYPPGNTRTIRRAGYRGNDVFRACVDTLVSSVTAGVLQIIDAQTREPYGVHPLLDIISRGGRHRPVPGMTAATLIGSMVRDRYTDGNALLQKIRNARGEVVELWRLDPAYVGVVPKRGGIERYAYNVGGIWHPIPTEDVIHWMVPDPEQPYFGVPPIVAALRDLAIANGLADHVKITIQNWAVPPVVLKSDQPLQETDAQKARDQWKQRYGGAHQGDVGVFGHGMDAKVIGLNMKDLAAVELAGLADDAICAVHRVPPILIAGGSKGDPTRANYSEAKEQLWYDAVIPLQNELADQFSIFLLPEFDGDRDPYGWSSPPARCSWDNSGVEVLAKAAIARAKDAAESFRAGLISRHAAQRLARLETQGPDVFYRPGSVGGIVSADSEIETMLEEAL